MARRVSALKIVAALAAAGVLALGAVAVIGVGIDAGRWREPVAAALSRALGREVRLDGPARLTLSLRPALRVGGVRVANPSGFDTPDFARIDELQVTVELVPLLRDEVRVSEVRGRGVFVRLARAGDGHGNWTFSGGAQDRPSARRRLDLRRVVLEDLTIEQAGEGATRRFEIAELSAEAPPGEPVRAALRGRGDGPAAPMARATGAPLSGLGTGEPWPFEFQGFLPGTVVNGTGTVSGPLDRPAVRIVLGAGAENLREAMRVLGVDGPPLSAAIAGELDLAPGGAALRSINGVIGETAIAGELALDTGGARPKLAGRLAVPALDSSLARSPRGAAEDAGTLAAAFDRLERSDLDLRRLTLLDADVELNVARLAGVPGDVRDLALRLRIDAGKLAAPLAATIAGARFQGELVADAASALPRLSARLAARDAPLDGLAELMFDVPHVAGSVRRIEAALDARGGHPGELVRDLEARISIEGAALTYGNFAGARPVAMRLDSAAAVQPRGRTIAANVRGSLRGKAFAGSLRAGTVEQILHERRTPFSFEGASGNVRARLSGTLAEPGDAAGPDIAVDLAAPRASELAPWLGFSSQADARVAFRGTVHVRRGHASLTDASLLAGRTSIAGDVTWRAGGDRALVDARLVAEVLAPAELRGLAATRTKPQRATLLELPILPESLDFADSDVALRVKRVDGLALELTDIAFQGRMRGGALAPSPVSLRVEGNALAGALALDARGDAPSASLWAAGEGVDLGAVLRRLRIARDVDARFGGVRFYAEVRERLLGDALEQSSFVAGLESGSLELRDGNTQAALRIAVDRAELRADAGAPLTASLHGTVGAIPVAVKARAGRLRELADPRAPLPFSITVESPAANLAVSGTAVPQRNPDVALSLALKGDRLDALDALFAASLPPWGPYALDARLRFSKRGYELDAMRLALGESVLTGSGSLDTARTPGKFDVSLAAGRIRIDDFPFGDWSPFGGEGGPSAPLTVGTARETVAAGARRAHAIFSREFLGRSEGTLDVAATRVVAGSDELGRGRLHAEVANGRATIGPVEVEGRAGSGRGSLVYEPRERDVVVAARVRIDRFDYGRLVRTFRPRSDIDGALSLDLRLEATAPRLSDALANGSGHFDFTVWPERARGGVFDLWSVNLLFRLLPFIDASASLMNCVAGRFDLEHGKLRSQRLVIDTMNTRTEGSGVLDFATSDLNLRFVPRSKVPQFFSLATPVEATGTFENYRFGIRRADALGTAARWVASPVVVPIQRLVGEPVPPDGSDVCVSPGR